MDRVVVVGGSVAAVNAVDGLRHAGFEREITLVSAEDLLPYDRPPLSKEALREGRQHEALLLKEPEWYDEVDVCVSLGTPAVGLDAAARTVALADGRELTYDGLVIATGSRTRSLPVLAAVPGVFEIRTLADTLGLHAELTPGRHLVVIGAGFIGLEVAATACKMGLDVSVVEIAPVPLTRVLGTELGHWFRDHQTDHGVRMHCGRGIVSVEVTAGGTRLSLDDGTELLADLIVAGVGVQPATGWLEGSGVELADGVVCDESLRTSVPGIVAAGDIVRWPNRLFGETMRVEQWLNAVEQGTHAAKTLMGGAEPFAPVPYFWSDQFEAKVKFVGHVNGDDELKVARTGDSSLVALFGRGERLRGALCINAPRQLAFAKRDILQGVTYQDAVAALG
ncbi:NAD(P)/FAD-dependent oxidoreductase [Nocardioides sp. LS1]|uniref:NAD(P)/FAD-dependent oxidoreductase n=1 Tax=Nocardioides sp. LS1 TaxID=1027620 RepID=UPI0021AB3642|nr:FAD-dependent oxidoreductase [Nocardioides sp. LS1]